MRRERSLTYFFLLLIVGIMINASVVEAGTAIVGISPTKVIADRMLPGSHLEKELILSSETSGYGVNVELKGDAEEWVSLPGVEDLEFLSGQSTLPLTLMVDVPDTAALGTYVVKGKVSLVPKVDTGNTFSLAVGLTFSVEITVIDEEITDFHLVSTQASSVEEGSELEFVLKIENEGNTHAKPKVVVELWDKFKDGVLESYEFENVVTLAPFTQEEFMLEVPTALSAEQYVGIVKVYDNDEYVNEKESPFNILIDSEQVEGMTYEEFMKEKHGIEVVTRRSIQEARTLFLRAALGAAAIAAIVIFYLREKKRKKKSKGIW